MPTRYEVRIDPVEDRRRAVSQCLGALRAPYESPVVEHLLQTGGLVRVERSRRPAELLKGRLQALGVETTIEPVDLAAALTYRVRGRVTREGEPVTGLTVRAFDHDLHGRDPLGTTVTDGDGRYDIEWTMGGFATEEDRGPDIVVVVVDERGDHPEALARSRIHFNADRRTTIDVELPESTIPTEYARLLAELASVTDGTAVETLDDDEVHALAAELALAERSGTYPAGAETLRVYSDAARMEVRTGIPAEVLYAMGRGGIELTEPALREVSMLTASECIEASAADGIVSNDLVDALDWVGPIMGRLPGD